MTDIFKKLIKRLEDVKKLKEVSVPIEVDEHGYIDKECPNKDCLFQFKVLQEDWINILRDEQVFCPRCGEDAPADHYWTTYQLEQAKNQAIKLVRDLLTKGKPFPRSIIPIKASDSFELHVKCDLCSTNYSVQGSGFYCPNCGNNSIEKIYANTLSKIKAKIHSADSIQNLLQNQGLEEESKLIKQSIFRECLTDCVVAFQMKHSYLFEKYYGEKKSPNSFQNLEHGEKNWKKHTQISYKKILGEEEFKFLFIQFQRRHLIQHCASIVDKEYIDKTKDSTYKVGQELFVTKHDVMQTFDLTTKLTEEIEKEAHNK